MELPASAKLTPNEKINYAPDWMGYRADLDSILK
jgi:hypothetical protein